MNELGLSGLHNSTIGTVHIFARPSVELTTNQTRVCTSTLCTPTTTNCVRVCFGGKVSGPPQHTVEFYYSQVNQMLSQRPSPFIETTCMGWGD